VPHYPSKGASLHRGHHHNQKQDYYAPSLVLSGTTSPTEAVYCFLSQVLPWTDDNNPDVPLQTQKYLKNV
jgi:hypothetical protein